MVLELRCACLVLGGDSESFCCWDSLVGVLRRCAGAGIVLWGTGAVIIFTINAMIIIYYIQSSAIVVGMSTHILVYEYIWCNYST